MNAQTLTSSFGSVLQSGVERSAARRRAALKTPLNTGAPRAVPQCATPDAINAGYAALLASYRADPVAFRRAVAVKARAARNQAIFGAFKRILFGQ